MNFQERTKLLEEMASNVSKDLCESVNKIRK